MPPEICLMKTLLRHSAPIVCAAGLAAALAAPAPALAQQGAVRATHGAWSIVCDTPPGASAEQCVLMQNVCFTDGCYAEVILEESLIKNLSEGTDATFYVFQTPEEGIGIPVDLDGFEDGYKALP